MPPKNTSSQSPPSKPALTSPYPITGKPWQRRFPTPRIQDYIVSVREDTRAGEFRMPAKGDVFKGVDQQKRLSAVYKFATAVPVEQLPGYMDLYYIAPFKFQEEYNFTVEYPYTDRNYPRFTRTYIVPRTDDVATKEPQADTFDPGFGKPFQLTDHKIERFTDDPILDAAFVKVLRVFERLPSPIITSFESNQHQQVVTVKTQEVVKSVPPSQSALTEGMKQERTGTAKAKNTLGSVPRVFPEEGLTTEIPSMTRELWMGGFNEQSQSQVQAGGVSQPVLNTPGNYAITEKHLTEFKKEVTVRSLPMPQERHHKELTQEFGGGVLSEDMFIDTPTSPLDIDEGFLVTESKLRNLAGFGKVKMTKELFELENSNIEVLANGQGYTSPPTIALNPNPGNVAAAHAVMGKAVASVVVDNGGGQYDFPPAVAFIGDCLIPATGIAFLTKGLASILLTNPGNGYSSSPTVVLTGGGGTGAAATAIVGKAVSSVGVTNQGSGYVSPQIQIVGDGVGATAIVKPKNLKSGKITKITLTNSGIGYTTPPSVVITDTGPGTGAAATTILVSTGRIKTVNITNPGQNYLYAPAVTFTGGGGKKAAAIASLGTTGRVNRVVVTSAGVGYFNPPLLEFSGGSSNPNIAQAQAHSLLTSTLHVAAVILDTPGTYTPGASAPTVVFSGGGGSGAVAQYNIGGWPVLYGSTVDPKYGLVTQITKRIVPAGTTWRPGLGFTEVHPHDKWRSIMVTSRNDPRSLPAPIVYPTVRQVALPSTLLNVVPNWVTNTEDAVQGEKPPEFPVIGSGYETDSAIADIQGSFDVQVAHGYHGPASAIVMELFFPGPPDAAFLPSVLNIIPSYGTVTLMTTGTKRSETVATAGTTSRRYGHNNRTTTRVESRTIGPVLTGGFLDMVSNSANATATGWTPTPVPVSITVLDNSGWMVVTKQVYISPAQIEANASARLSVNVPPSTPLALPSGINFLETMDTVRLGLNVWMVRLVYVYVP